jgi:hypothetical protein
MIFESTSKRITNSFVGWVFIDFKGNIANACLLAFIFGLCKLLHKAFALTYACCDCAPLRNFRTLGRSFLFPPLSISL